jgi:hypothetical protein
MKLKIVLWSSVLFIILGLIALAVWWELRPQIITFSDDSKLTLLSVDYGKHHKTKSVTHSFTTTDDALVVWVREQYDSQDWHNFQYYLYNREGTACIMGSESYMGNGRNRGNQTVAIQFSAFPRREGKFYLRAQENGNGGQELSDQKFVISNPARGSFGALSPVPLPDTEEDGDMSVTLKKLTTGAKTQFTRDNDDPDDPINLGVQAIFQVQLNGTNANAWQPVAVALSDATSNRDDVMSVNTQEQGDDLNSTFQYGLWPDEPAWKLRVEFSKQYGFNNTELWNVSGIPLQPGRMRDFWNYGRRQGQATVFAETDLQDLHLQVFPVKQFTDMPPNSQPQGGLTIQVSPALPDGMRLTLVKLTDDQNNDISHWDYGQNQTGKNTIYHYGLQNLDGVTNVNLTLALHRSRFLEFTAKPEIAPADASDQSNQ